MQVSSVLYRVWLTCRRSFSLQAAALRVVFPSVHAATRLTAVPDRAVAATVTQAACGTAARRGTHAGQGLSSGWVRRNGRCCCHCMSHDSHLGGFGLSCLGDCHLGFPASYNREGS